MKGDFLTYIGGAKSKHLTLGKTYRTTVDRPNLSNKIAVIADNNKRLVTNFEYFVKLNENDMKKGQLKQESVKILKQVATHIEDSRNDYDSEDLKALMSEALAYYNLYLLKKSNRRVEAHKLESMIVPKWEEGLRAEIREYFDEA